MMFVPVLVGGIWWWHTWPERTARRFHQYLVQGNVEAAQAMSQSQLASDFAWVVKSGESEFLPPRIHGRSWSDWFFSRGEFNVNADQEARRFYFGRFVVSRGTVKPPKSLDEPVIVIAYQIQFLSADVALQKIRSGFASDTQCGVIAQATSSQILVMATEKNYKTIGALLGKFDRQPSQIPLISTK